MGHNEQVSTEKAANEKSKIPLAIRPFSTSGAQYPSFPRDKILDIIRGSDTNNSGSVEGRVRGDKNHEGGRRI